MDGGNGRLSANRSTGFFGTVHMVIFVAAIVTATVIAIVVVFPTVLISIGLARKIARLWNRMVLRAGGVRVKVIGGEKIDPKERYVFMSNHQSALDIPIIYKGLGERISFIAKKELFAIPGFGWGMYAVGHISMDRSNARKARASLEKAVRRLKKNNVSLILFPEGTRSKDGRVKDFKTASFTLAQQAGARLVPVAIKGAIDRLPPRSKRIIPGEVTLEIGDPISVEELQSMSKTEICEKVHGIIKKMAEG